MNIVDREHILITLRRSDYACYPCSAILDPRSDDPAERARNPRCTLLMDRGFNSACPWFAVLFDFTADGSTTPKDLSQTLKTGVLETSPDVLSSVIFPDGTSFALEWESIRLAARMQQAAEWSPEDCKRLCEMAGLLQEWQSAEATVKDCVTERAAELLGVHIL